MTNQFKPFSILILFKLIITRRIFIMTITSFFVILSIIHALIFPKYYQTNVTFYINEQTINPSIGSYAKLLGIDNSSNIESKLKTLIKSLRLKHLLQIIYLRRLQNITTLSMV